MSASPDRASDFRSDTVTLPTPAMRRAMADAEVGDDVLDGDPTVRRLEARAAAWLGKEGAWFVPSGTMANQVAVGAWTRPGDEAIAEERAHVLLYESGALGALHGVQAVTFRSEDGDVSVDAVRRLVRPLFLHCPRTGLVCLEQTHLESGGSVVPLESLRAVGAFARERGIPVHLDGARLANAVVASGVPAAEYAACADSVSICLSKGLGAPVGSLVAGDAAFLERARLLRKRLGGWMRQCGILAAAGLLALEEGVERLAEDHALARELAERLDALPGVACPPGRVATNIVFVSFERDDLAGADVAARLAERGVLALPHGDRGLRLVTHRDVGPADAERLEGALRAILSAPHDAPRDAPRTS